MAVYKRGGSEPVILGDGGNLLSLEVGKRGIFQQPYKRTLKKVALMSRTVRRRHREAEGFDDRNAVVALPQCVGDAGIAERQPPDNVQPAGGVVGGAT